MGVKHHAPSIGMEWRSQNRNARESTFHQLRAQTDKAVWKDLPRLHDLRDSLWPAPHSALFDFRRSPAQSRWIDELAALARESILSSGVVADELITHTDWSSKHFRFRDDSTVAIACDWYSLKISEELRSVGAAAATHPYNWYTPVQSMTPSPERMSAFTAEYGVARGRPFNVDEVLCVSAHACYVFCYIARCTYSLDPAKAETSDRELSGGEAVRSACSDVGLTTGARVP